MNKQSNLLRFTTLTLLMILMTIIACKKKDGEPEPVDPLPIANRVSIAELKSSITDKAVKITTKGVIRGVVISDSYSKNVDNENTLFLQEGTGGVAIKVILQAPHQYQVNDSLEIDVYDQFLNSINESIFLENVANNLVKKLGVGKILPRETSISELQANKKEWDGSLVAIKACELFSANKTFSNNFTLRDGQSVMAGLMFDKAVFSSQNLPGEVSSLVGIVYRDGDQVKLAPRNVTEVLPLRYITDDFTTWKNTTLSFNLAKENEALHTQFANWKGNIKDGTIKQLPVMADAGFSKSTKIYPYLPKDSLGSLLMLYPLENSSLKGVKVIRITFAASKSIGPSRFTEQSLSSQEINIDVLPFNTGTDIANVGVAIPIVSKGELIPGKLATPAGFDDYYNIRSYTPALNEAGKFYTVTFLLPTNTADLKKIGIITGEFNKWLESPVFKIINLSSRKTLGITTRNSDRYIPILIDKVEMGF